MKRWNVRQMSDVYVVVVTQSLAVWPDLAKFHHLSKSLQVFGSFLMVYLLFGIMLSRLLQICDIIGLIFSVANGQILKNNLTIWSHWTLSTTRSRTSTNYFLIVRTTQSFHSKCFNGIGIDDDMSRPWQVAFKFSWYWHFITYYYLPTYVDELLASVFLVLEAS